MKKWILLLFSCVFIVSLFSAKPVEAKEKNEKPEVIPSLQEWDGATGYFTVQSDSTIVVDPDHEDSLMDTAEVLKKDLHELIGIDVAIEVDNESAKHDIFLTLQDEEDESIGDEGYHLQVDDVLEIQANTETGVYYGTRSVLQILVQSPDQNEVAKGTATDFPKYEERGFMLDVGRKYFPIDVLEDYARIMGWYKMNDFQLHLNDNAIFKDNSEEHWDSYSAFRLESDTYPELTAKDGHYTKEAFMKLQDMAEKNSLNITPEFDTPSHALAFTKVRPDLTHPDLPVDHLDITRDESVDFVKSVWDEYLDMFDSDTVHIGADEFYQNDTEMSNVYRDYINTLNQHMQEESKSVRAWGGLTYYDGDVPVDQDVAFNIWNVGWYNPEQAVDEGYDIINSDDGLLYIVPKADYYHDYLDSEWIYKNWEPTDFSGGITLPEDEPQLKGGMFAIWNDLLGEKVSIPDVHDRVSAAMPTMAEKMWRGDSDDASFAEFEDLSNAIGDAPGTNLTYDVETKTDTVLYYPFDDVTGKMANDNSGNDYHGTLHGVEPTDEGKSGSAVTFDGSDSHIATDLDSKGFPWTVSTWVNLDETDQSEDILLESDYGSIKLKQKETGNVGFSREGHDYSFDTKIPTKKWVHVALRGDLNETSLFIDGELQDTVSRNMLLPVDTIGSDKRAFQGTIDEFKIYDKKLSSSEIASEADAPKWKINKAEGKPAKASSSETDEWAPDLAVDGDKSTRWSSAHSDDEWIYVDLLEKQPINKVVLNWEDAYAKAYKIQVSDDAENWKDVYETKDGAGGIETVNFPTEEARYIRMQGIERAINWGYSLYEMEVYHSPLQLDAPNEVDAGETFDVTTTFKNSLSEKMEDVEFSLDLPDEWEVADAEDDSFQTIEQGEEVTSRFAVTIPDNAEEGSHEITANAVFNQAGEEYSANASIDLSVIDPFKLDQSEMTASATSEETDKDPAENAIDGKEDTMWHTDWSGIDKLPQSINLDLGNNHTINKVSYLPRQTEQNGIITKYKLYTSTDGEDFEEIANGEWEKNAAEKQVTFDPIEARYVKLEAVEGVGGFASAAEINVFTPEPDDMSVSMLRDTLESYQDDIDSDEAFRLLNVHLQAVERYEDQKKGEKVVKHLKSFKKLLNKQYEEGVISGDAADRLKDQTDLLIKKWK